MATLEKALGQVPKSLQNIFEQGSALNPNCQRCDTVAYQMEKIGPVNEVVFHKGCFKCCQCNQVLTVKTYFTNQSNLQDKEVYCKKHAPKSPVTGLGPDAVGIRGAMNAPRPATQFNAQMVSRSAPTIDAQAQHIANPMAVQSEYQRRFKPQNDRHNYFPAYVVKKQKERIMKAQLELEKLQRDEEDRLMQDIMKNRQNEIKAMQNEADQEWEIRLEELTSKFEQDSVKKGSKKGDKKAMTVALEREKEDLKKNMTVKLQKKKEAATIRLQKKEQAMTAEMVAEHSKQMLDMLAKKQEEARQELEAELATGRIDFENEMNSDDELEEAKGEINGDDDGTEAHGGTEPPVANGNDNMAMEAALDMLVPQLGDMPAPHPPRCRKRDLYYDPSVFTELDEHVFNVAEKEQSTFTDLVMELTINCMTDLEKARAIFRWITVKDLNTLDFEEKVDQDTPLGLLRGIKYGTETYHTLFMRLCSYAGLRCVEIKGHSKSVGYEPGMKIREDSFQNTWNAVLIDGDWWPVQCNWGARHLVLNKDVSEKPAPKSKRQDKIRYQYDEHYFLTDPDEFIQEFWAQDEKWQLLERPVTLDEFEAMPFVRSVFFHYGLDFQSDHTMRAVITTDSKGGAEVKIRVPEEFTTDIVFHYQLRFADRERRADTEFRGARLERFVFHSLSDTHALFSVHVPTSGEFFLEIFANKIDDSNKVGDDPNATMMPFRLKCACKFKVVCYELVGKMHPLPNCASGEWGPSKGVRHFGLKPLTHMTGVVSVVNECELKFTMPRPLHFLCKLRMNGVDEVFLEKYVSYRVEDNVLYSKVQPPQQGQYGLDIYARPEDATDNHTLAHACKYLLNCTAVEEPTQVPVSKVDSRMSKDKWGAAASFKELGLTTVSHTDPTIDKTDTVPLVIELALSDALKFSYHLIREPDEDHRESVTLKDNGKKAKFTLTLSKPGNYLFAIYARKKKGGDGMVNVYNYMVRFTPDEKSSTLKNNKKSKGLFGKK